MHACGMVPKSKCGQRRNTLGVCAAQKSPQDYQNAPAICILRTVL